MQPMVARNRYSNGLELADAFDASSLWGDAPVAAQTLYSTRDACAMLHIDRTTLHRWLHAAGMQSVDDPADKRITGYTRGQLAELAKRHHRALGEPPAQPEPSRRMRELEHEVELLKARVARLEGQQGISVDGGGQLSAAQNRPTERHTPKLPKLPPGATTYRQLIEEYHADERTVRRWIADDEMPVPTTEGGPWRYAATIVKRIYTAEQLPAARAALARLTGQADT